MLSPGLFFLSLSSILLLLPFVSTFTTERSAIGGAGAIGATITIKPGDDIQAAVNSLHHSNGGGTVLFTAGVYTIYNTSILVYSNIALKGETGGAGVTLQVDPHDLKFNVPAITNNNAPVSNVTISDLAVVCNVQPSEQKYPAYCLQCSRNCSGNSASDPGCSCLTECPHSMRTNAVGIAFGGGGTDVDSAQNVNFVLEHLQVSHCAMGVTMSGWRVVHIDALELHTNGMIQAYFHNMYLRRNFQITMTNMRSHDSPTGNGVNISMSSFITVLLGIFNDNYWRGLRIEGEEGYIVHNINVHQNQCNGNGDYGFRFANVQNGVVYNNSAANNQPTNVYKANLKNVTFTNNQW